MQLVSFSLSETTDFRPDQFMGYRISAWKRSISQPIDIDKRISLITAIFSDHSVAKVAENLCRDDAQAFVDVVDEVLPHPSVQGKWFTDMNLLSLILSRHWVVWDCGSRGSV